MDKRFMAIVAPVLLWASLTTVWGQAVKMEEKEGFLAITTPHFQATLAPAHGAHITGLTFKGVQLVPKVEGRQSYLASVRLTKPSTVKLEGEWRWKVEKQTATELILAFETSSNHFAEYIKRYRFRADIAAIDVAVTLRRQNEGMNAGKYTYWIKNFFATPEGGLTYWFPNRPGGAMVLSDIQKGQAYMYEPGQAAAGVFNKDGIGLVFMPQSEHLDFVYYWFGGSRKGTLEWGSRHFNLDAGGELTSGFRIMPVALNGDTPIGILGNDLIVGKAASGSLTLKLRSSGKGTPTAKIETASSAKEPFKAVGQLRQAASLKLSGPKGVVRLTSETDALTFTVDGNNFANPVGPKVRRIGKSNDPERNRQTWLQEPKLGEVDLVVGNFNGTMNLETKKGALKPIEVMGKASVVKNGKFGGALHMRGGKNLLKYSAEGIINPKRGAVEAWVRADYEPKSKQWRHIFHLPGEDKMVTNRKGKKRMKTHNSIALLQTGYDQIGAYIHDDKGNLHRAYRNLTSLPKGKWTHLRMVWDMEKPVSGKNYVEIFINGTNEGNTYGLTEKPFSFKPVSKTALVGRNFKGMIDALRISAKASAEALPPARGVDVDAVAPAITWALPSATKPVKALFIIDHAASKDVALLQQMMPLDPTIVKFIYASKADAIHTYYEDEKILSHNHFLDRLRLALGNDYDVIITSPLSWKTHIPAEVQRVIVEKVKAGTSLVALTPHEFTGQPIAEILPVTKRGKLRRSPYRGMWKAGEAHPITKNFALKALLPTQYVGYTAAKGKTLLKARRDFPVLQVSQAGKGKVLVGGYCAQNAIGRTDYFRSWGALTPTGISIKGEYAGMKNNVMPSFQMLLVRSILWAAGRKMAATYELAGYDAKARILNLNVMPTVAGPVTARIRIGTLLDEWSRSFEVSGTLKKGLNQLPISVPFGLPGGRVKVDVQIMNKSGVLVFGANIIEQPATASITDMILVKPGYRIGEKGEVAMTIKADANMVCRLTVTDRFGRVTFVGKSPAKTGGFTMTFDTAGLLPPFVRVTAELLRADGSVAAVAVAGGILKREPADVFGKFAFFGWGNAGGRMEMEAGVASFAAKGPGALNSAAAGTNALPYLWKEFHGKMQRLDSDRETRKPCLCDPAFLAQTEKQLGERVRYWKQFMPFAYFLADEVRFSPLTYVYFEGCHHPESLKAFRSWLKERYGDLAGLNKQWGMKFATWDAVKPMTARELQKSRQKNLAPFADFREFGEVTWARYLKKCRNVVRGADSKGLTVLSGTVSPDISNGYDFWRVVQSVDIMNVYRNGPLSGNKSVFRHGPQQELARSYAPYSGTKTLPYAAGYGRKGPELFYRMWGACLNQYTGMNSWGSSFFFLPEGSLTENGRDTAEMNQLFRKGMWDYVRGFKRETPVAVLYSMPSMRAAFALGKRKEFHGNIDGLTALLHDLCIGWKYVAPQQLESGILSKESFRLLILPQTRALSDKEMAAIAAYVKKGGRVLMSSDAGSYDASCTPRGQNLKAMLAKVRASVVSINDTNMSPYAIYGQYYKQKPLAEWQEKWKKIFRGLGVRPFLTRISVDRKPFHGMSAAYTLGENRLIIALPMPSMIKNDKATMIVQFPGTYNVYLPVDGRFLQESHAVKFPVRKGWAAVTALTKKKVAAPTLKCEASIVKPGGELRYRITPAAAFAPTAMTVTLSGPDGKALAHYRRAVICSDGKPQTISIKLALNDAPGQYSLEATDMLTGTVRKAMVVVK
jgi:Beta-galactosidase/Concanavalin A-like lectin/glucanases superfamily